jgi:hypothetical protein
VAQNSFNRGKSASEFVIRKRPSFNLETQLKLRDEMMTKYILASSTDDTQQ